MGSCTTPPARPWSFDRPTRDACSQQVLQRCLLQQRKTMEIGAANARMTPPTSPPARLALAAATTVTHAARREIDRAGVQRAARELLRPLGADIDDDRDLKIHERISAQITDRLEHELEPSGVAVLLEGEHMCMSLRGVQKFGAGTLTSALRGLVRDGARTRQELLALSSREIS